MRKNIMRLRNVVRRITEPLTRLESTSKVIIAGLGLLGTGFISWDLQRAKPWLFADWAHMAVSALALGFVGAFLALYGLEKELDEMKIVRVAVLETATELRPILHFNFGESLQNVFCLEINISLRNDSEKATRAFFPTFELLGKNERGRWDTIPLNAKELGGRGGPKGLQGLGNLWFPEDRFEIPERDEIHVRFWIIGTTPGGATPFLRRDLKIRLTVDILGQSPNMVCETVLPRIEAPMS